MSTSTSMAGPAAGSAAGEPRTAFVLAGGAALGAMQAGMVHALYERGIAPDLLIGTSAGALNAAFLASRPAARHLQFERLEQAAIPLHLVAFDLLAGTEVRLSDGPSVDAVLAAAAIPGVLPPVRWRGRLLADGGIADNTPVSHGGPVRRRLAAHPRGRRGSAGRRGVDRRPPGPHPLTGTMTRTRTEKDSPRL